MAILRQKTYKRSINVALFSIIIFITVLNICSSSDILSNTSCFFQDSTQVYPDDIIDIYTYNRNGILPTRPVYHMGPHIESPAQPGITAQIGIKPLMQSGITNSEPVLTQIAESQPSQTGFDISEPEQPIASDNPGQPPEVPEKQAGQYLILVNKSNPLPSDYVPDDLVVPNVNFTQFISEEEQKMRKDAAAALEELFRAAEKEGITLYCESGYRSYDLQERIFVSIYNKYGPEFAFSYSAMPGKSEHQTGLAMDITNMDHIDDENDLALGSTREGIWMAENCHRFGFILRYPKEKESITGYKYEPWHLRYVGKEAAEIIMKEGLVLEEYLSRLESSRQ